MRINFLSSKVVILLLVVLAQWLEYLGVEVKYFKDKLNEPRSHHRSRSEIFDPLEKKGKKK